MECKNCGNDFTGKFCNECGQKNVDGRITIREILHNFIHSFTHIDSGIFFLIKELFIRPGAVVREYLSGKRKKYFNPFQFLIIAIAIAAFLAVKFTLFGPNIDPDTIEALNSQQRFWLLFNKFIYRNFNLILFLSVPVAAVYSRLIFRKSGYNYAEHLVFNTFLAAERTVLYIILTPLIYFTKSNWTIGVGIYYILWVIYYGYSYVSFFGGNKFITILKYICVLLLLMLTSQTISMSVFYFFFYK
ncbi:MAG TPA: DUF3667 domain-containing protein [Ignavibacteria bacterium]|nr:DUF3667 domain-containing protein [Ignavibacteria bacterium]HQY52182.1 DUF3667 domain-containing protein [Ignavibacteria bacterium]HRA98858.1 DUF3667 domain-containing protein [Ignavibacteria bacterium]